MMLTIYDQDGNDVEVPAKHEVCEDCEGHGTTLTESLRGAFSSEEFDACFEEEEDRAEYFKRGGAYDVPCKSCRGARVIVVPDYDSATEDQREMINAWQEDEYAAAAEDRFIRQCRDRGIEY